jgi:hypothetical protein
MSGLRVIPAARTFRKWALTAFAGAGFALAVGGMLAVVISHARDLFYGAPFNALFAYFFWLVGWHSAVRLDREQVIVDNLLVRHVIPWGELSEIGVGNGLFFRLRDGRMVGSIMYGGSVIGALLRYRYTRGVAARMRAARDELLAGTSELPSSDGYVQRIGFSPWPPLLIVALMEAIASLSLLR